MNLLLLLTTLKCSLAYIIPSQPNRPLITQLPALASDDVSILEGISPSFEQVQWLMPSLVERALVHQDESVDPVALLSRLDMSSSEREEALVALESSDGITTVPQALTPEECAKLRNFVRKQIKDDGIDDVDGCPDWQVNMSEKKFEKVVGRSGVDKLWKIPQHLNENAMHFSRVGVFVRMYQTGMRPWMPFHRDDNAFTVNVALNDDHDYKGGRLLALHDNALQVLRRNEGDATCHKGSVFHAVSATTEGTRYSLILFFHE